jgi:ABC-type multidrug transport system fused ATPase/permease subunit
VSLLSGFWDSDITSFSSRLDLSASLLSIFHIVTVVLGGARCAKNVFLAMLQSVLIAPVSYFETTPLGRILNRFTYDVEVIDVTLTESMSILMIAAGWFTTGVVVMVSIVPYVALALLPVTTIYWMLLLKYRRCGTDLQRLDAVARSPIHALVSEGTSTTRSWLGTLVNGHGFTLS